LFITSGSGLGKTHLLNAIGNRVKDSNSNARILFTSIEGFANEFKEASQNNKLAAFREKFRNLDMLLIDDVHFLSGKVDVQEELFHTFNALYNAGKQVALTSDRPPKEIPDLEDRLVSRFESGLIADIQSPDFETRLAILKRRVKDSGVKVDAQVLEHIARVIESNIRELGGALNRVVAFSSLMGQTASLALAKEVLKDLAPEREEHKGRPSLEQIMRELKPGRSYLVEEERAVNVFRLFAKAAEGKGAGMVVTRTNPKRVRERYGLRSERIIWLTDRESTSEETMPPTLERLIYMVEEFMRVGGKGAVMLDGVEYLVSNNSFDAVLRFLRRLVDHVSESQFVLLLSISPKTMKEQEVKILEREMEAVSF
jgi:archaellum biogenesis ATPase FlaH